MYVCVFVFFFVVVVFFGLFGNRASRRKALPQSPPCCSTPPLERNKPSVLVENAVTYCFHVHGETTGVKMIKGVLIVNNYGKPRLVKFYEDVEVSIQKQTIREIFTQVSKRQDNVCNFLSTGSVKAWPDTLLV